MAKAGDASGRRPPLAVTMGDPGGVGAEIAIAAWRRLNDDGPCFFLLDDPDRLRAQGATVTVIDAPAQAASVFASALPVLPLSSKVVATSGVSTSATAPLVLESIERAVAYAIRGEAAGVVTNPIQKSSLIDAGFKFPGHTEFLEALTKSSSRAVMMIAGPALRTVPVTIHQSVQSAAASLSEALIYETGMIVHTAMQNDFGLASPRLLFSGLNPHAGEAGALGREEIEIVAPAITRLREAGVNASGPAPADTMFHARARETYDVALCMLHDQALIPAKALAFDDAVNVTLGLPIVRTSPDHGTALDIAGKGVARPDSLIAALRLAARLSQTRAGNSA
jgi:4-hydroxythreonine-4-phosphate dehydrogenase